jgi:HTH-type transcriptional regulator / antitoxin HigA
LESNYRLFRARQQKDGSDAIARRGRLYSLAPIAELIKRGWLRRSETIDELERDLCTFLEIDSPAQIPEYSANFRQARSREPDAAACLVWTKRVQHLARAQQVSVFDPEALRAALPCILALAKHEEDVRRLPAELLGLGVHFLIVPKLDRTYLDGAALAVDGRPTIALTLRYDRIDYFWFTLMHELAHIALQHEGSYLDDDSTLKTTEPAGVEHEANRHACDWLLEPAAFDIFIVEQRSHFTKRAIQQFAHDQQRHPGIVLGQLQYRGYVSYNQHRSLLVKVKPMLTDWIDVAGPQVGR